jgi:hypothetical protein
LIILIIFGKEYKSQKFLVLQFSPPSSHLIPLRSKYFLKHPFLKHLQYIFLP